MLGLEHALCTGKQREVRLLILGLDSAGKTTILRRVNHEDTSAVAPSM